MRGRRLHLVHNSSVLLLPPHTVSLLQCGLSMDFSSFRNYPPAPAWGPPWSTVWMCASVQRCLWVAGKYLIQCLKHFPHHFFADFGVRRAVPHPFFPLFLCWFSSFCPFLNTFSQRGHHHGWGAQQLPVVDLLKMAGSSCAQHRADPTASAWAPTPDTVL